ncbi:hypothetical protein NB600_02240 [Vibrio antiquarius]|uniref:hypothetical protein n=1 Tax=Vibrio antiquarius (strain Ex25) TaxID=150340 RepID=UPI00265D4728|nr:hypothetical protein [Vibrio antiquarius]MCR9684643.1 hypothetical protein [Vibrio antiquarius]
MLILDFGFHFKQMIHASYYWGRCDTVLLSNDEDLNKGDFNRIYRFKTKFSALKILMLMFFYLIKGDRVVVLTAPEYGERKYDELVRFIFLFICMLFGKKIDLYIKNTHVYIGNKYLYGCMKYVKTIHFESKTQLDYFLSQVGISKDKCRVTYVYYPDVYAVDDSASSDLILKKDKINVGLLGQFDSERREYKKLYSLGSDFYDRYRLIQIGRVRKDHFKTQCDYKNFKCNGMIMFIKDEYCTRELDFLLSQCDMLISFNSPNFNYDKGKGTAVFSEAISHKKKLLVPKFLPQANEFSSFCDTFDNNLEQSINKLNIKSVSSCVWKQYSVERVRLKV